MENLGWVKADFYAEKKGLAVIALGSMVNKYITVAKEVKEEGQPITGI